MAKAAVEYAVKFFERHMEEDVLRFGERQAIHIALAALREQDTPNKNAVKTNADRIRAMTDEELAKCVFDFCCEPPCEWCEPTMRTQEKCNGRCTTGVLAWLQQPVKEETK